MVYTDVAAGGSARQSGGWKAILWPWVACLSRHCVLWPSSLAAAFALLDIGRSSPYGPTNAKIVLEALISLGIFVPAIALAYPSLQDVTYRGELAKRCVLPS